MRDSPVRRLIPFLRPYRGRLALAAVCLVAASATTLALPAALRHAVDATMDALRGSGSPGLQGPFSRIALLAVLAAVLTALRHDLVTRLGEAVVTDLRTAVFARVVVQPPTVVERLRTGDVLSRLSSDMAVVQSLVGSSLSMALRSAILVAGATLWLMSIRPWLVVAMLGIVVLFVAPMVWMGRRVRTLSRTSQDRLAEAQALAGEVIPALDTVQAWGRQHAEAQRYADAAREAREAAIRRTHARSAMIAVAMTALLLANVYGLYLGVQAVIAGSLGAGTLGQIVLLMAMIASSASVLAEVWGEFARASGAASRIIELLDLPAQPDGPATAQTAVQSAAATAPPPVGSAPALRFDAVGFAYPGRSGVGVIDALTLDVPAGATIALVGPSGAGKSTLFALLLRLRHPARGRILADGVDIATMPPAQWRARIASVPQHPVIFSGSIAANVRYGRPDATDADVRAAATRAGLAHWLDSLPDGLATRVGERGMELSGGQRQRVAIARALLADRPILLLDEATSALDADSEAQVQQAFDALRAHRTTLVIAHRLATVRGADRIVVLEAGRIVDQGTHDALMARDGLYARLARLQFHDGPRAGPAG